MAGNRPVAWQELGAFADDAAAALGSCFLLGHALRGLERSMAFNLYPPLLIAISILWSLSALAREGLRTDSQNRRLAIPRPHRYFPGDAAHGFPPPPITPNI
jgi:hypothetical protein